MLTVEQILASDWPMGLNPDFDGACPCNVITGDGFEVETHCWRTSRWRNGKKCTCQFSGVHVSGSIDHETKLKIAAHVRDNNGWAKHTDWETVIE